MKYIPVSSEAEAMSVSALIYDLTRPSGGSTDTTQYSVGWKTDINGVCYLCMDLAFQLPVHPDRGTAIESAIRGLQAAGKILPASADALLATVAANSGSTVTLEEVVPPEWLAVSVDSIVLPPEPELPA